MAKENKANTEPIVPSFYLESKHADIEAYAGDDVHYSWQLGRMLLTVEYMPDNWPCLTISCIERTAKSMEQTLEELGFEITKDEDSKR